ncbi:MAG: hypothetical protein QMD04_04135 [Anaerolineales bacterium]|nr:hypothetical protein [Anaerolineales bacterium]
MTIDLILFLILAIVAIATALGMLLSRNAIYPKEMLLEPVPSWRVHNLPKSNR